MYRHSKIALVAAVAAQMILIVADNLLDYDTNFEFVRHVLLMDTLFSDRLHWRSLESPFWHHAFYGGIIVWEAAIALLTTAGTLRLWRARRADAAAWRRATALAETGLVLSLLLWFFAFLVVGGEWFQMWQSQKWNGQPAALRQFVVHGLILLYLLQADRQ